MAGASQNRDRQNRIQLTTDRYLRNIMGSKSYQRDMDRFRNANDFGELRRLDYQMQNRQYSQNTYMGLSNG